MINYEDIELKDINKNEFDEIYSSFLHDKIAQAFVHFENSDAKGIFYKGKIVGLFKLANFIDNSLCTTIYIKEEYRGLGLAMGVRNKIVEIYGPKNPEVKQFIANIKPNNKNSNKSMKDPSWKQTHEYDEIMIDEGAEFFNIYSKPNPCYVLSYSNKS